MHWPRLLMIIRGALFLFLGLVALLGTVQGTCTSYASRVDETAPVFVACTCAKCGSSSVQQALMESIIGGNSAEVRDHIRVEYNTVDGLHHPERWSVDGAGSCEPNFINSSSVRGRAVLMFWVTRDPVSRYLSAFRSKYRCCAGTKSNSSNRKICMDDQLERIPNILRYASRLTKGRYQLPAPDPVNCLTFDEYITYLSATANYHNASKLDAHIQPQQTYCPDVFDKITKNGVTNSVRLSGNISQLFEVLTTLRDTFPHKIVARHKHASHESNMVQVKVSEYEPELRKLCTIAQPEYEAMNDWEGMKTCLENARQSLMTSGI